MAGNGNQLRSKVGCVRIHCQLGSDRSPSAAKSSAKTCTSELEYRLPSWIVGGLPDTQGVVGKVGGTTSLDIIVPGSPEVTGIMIGAVWVGQVRRGVGG